MISATADAKVTPRAVDGPMIRCPDVPMALAGQAIRAKADFAFKGSV